MGSTRWNVLQFWSLYKSSLVTSLFSTFSSSLLTSTPLLSFLFLTPLFLFSSPLRPLLVPISVFFSQYIFFVSPALYCFPVNLSLPSLLCSVPPSSTLLLFVSGLLSVLIHSPLIFQFSFPLHFRMSSHILSSTSTLPHPLRV